MRLQLNLKIILRINIFNTGDFYDIIVKNRRKTLSPKVFLER